MSDHNARETTQEFSVGSGEPRAGGARLPPEARPPDCPAKIGRYRVEGILGRGNFGLVYLARDDQLDRFVAVKVPHASLVSRADAAQEYLTEARTVAKLDHPHIVPVYDVGSSDEFPCYIVSKYVEGTNLAAYLKRSRPKYAEAAELVATVAEALHYAHKQGLVHRDVKCGNILVGRDGKPHVVDFGVALREEDLGKGPRHVGTPAYMSPEQARGEGHRVDGRSDIYSLGTVFYELLTGRRTFIGESKTALLQQIAALDPKPPRQIDDRIPKELERICLKALCKRAAERYTTALDMCDDLRHFLAETEATPTTSSAPVTKPYAADLAGTHDISESSTLGFGVQPVPIVPKGLRSFDERDADFFLELLPGPRDRDGMPDSLQFWKVRIEETDPDKTFPVGLIYGPSGCGKTSLVKAGLLPRLSADVISIYVEATPDETERQLLHNLRKHCAFAPRKLNLKDTLAALRRSDGVPEGKKVLIVLDQFEQWLHARQADKVSDLVLALRQCDGRHVQCIVMVRDDFWMAATRFMRDLEIHLAEAQNSAAVDLFPVRHAEKVLAAFGRAFGAMPQELGKTTADQEDFVKQAVAGLAEEGKVTCVRLAVFAEMVKGKSWTPATLEEMGGATGVGVTFLEETFSASTAPPERRFHQKAARAVLKTLLPEPGTDIKGQMKSREELLEASGYQDRNDDFDELIKILDIELRLITPTDPAGSGDTEDSTSRIEETGKYYQLTHDYLVPSLRDWLTRKQRETRRGRAELRLTERAAIWHARPERRHLPSMWEYVAITSLTSRKQWSANEKRMMRAAARLYRTWWSVGCFLLLAALGAGAVVRHKTIEAQSRAEANGLIDQLLVAGVAELPAIAAALDKTGDRAVPRLEAVADDAKRPAAERLRATFALANRPNHRAMRLVEFASAADLPTLRAVLDRLSPFASELEDQLWSAIRADGLSTSSILRLGALIAAASPNSGDWEEIAPSVADALLAESSLDLDAWIELLKPAALPLTAVLRDRFLATGATSNERVTAARALAHYAQGRLLSDLLLEADAASFVMLLSGATRQRNEVVATIRESLQETPGSETADERRHRVRRQRNAAIALLQLDATDFAEPLLANALDPSVRTKLMLEMREFGVSPEIILKALRTLDSPSARQALLLALEPYRGQDLSPRTERETCDLLAHLLRSGKRQSERSAAEWLLRRWDHREILDSVTQEIVQARSAPDDLPGDRDWYMTGEGHAMAVVRGPVAFNMGSPENELGRDVDESLFQQTIGYSFAVSVHEVTIEQYLRVFPGALFALGEVDGQCSANYAWYDQALEYCQWLSKREGIAEDQWCYSPLQPPGKNAPMISDERLARTGYRLLTETEWEYVSRAGTSTPWFTGSDETCLVQFAWFALNDGERARPVGLLRPNALGLFDTMGNVSEWCHTLKANGKYALRGGDYRSLVKDLRTARRFEQSNTGYSFTGIRLARTLPAAPAASNHTSSASDQ